MRRTEYCDAEVTLLNRDFIFDADYLARLRAKDRDTQNHFYDYFYIPIRNKVRHSLRGTDADDVVQEVFAKAFERIDAGEPHEPNKLPGYIFGICHNLLLQEYSRRKQHVTLTDIDMSKFEDLRESIEARLIRKLDRPRVDFILEKLPQRYREAIERVYLREQDRRVAALAMRTTIDNLRLILHRAKERFREEWERYFGSSPFGETI